VLVKSLLHPDGRSYALNVGALTQSRLQMLTRLARQRRLARPRRMQRLEARSRKVVAIFLPDLEPEVLADLPLAALEQVIDVAMIELRDALKLLRTAT
jgi:hypothetical protein